MQVVNLIFQLHPDLLTLTPVRRNNSYLLLLHLQLLVLQQLLDVVDNGHDLLRVEKAWGGVVPRILEINHSEVIQNQTILTCPIIP